ncbi:PBAN-type neuropeptides-like isoform X1 [Colletes gigas]|uniref:PBAN-type neuropeptides-like isoform X1 n=1 Tax=Colletes gigas TaxID=935657 RepID=UPI001C9B2238|nr:PBAN-type neuropeptides-like isoform X1 [Colletes gigas]
MIGSSVFSHLRVTGICALVCLIYSVHCSNAEYAEGREFTNDRTPVNEFVSCAEGKCIKRASSQPFSGMWFGPRLGKRHKADKNSEADPDLEALANILDTARWGVLAVPGGEKRQSTQFTPRLGRDSGEEFFSYRSPKDQEELYAEEQLFPPLFAPRLGRRLPWTPSPRLGRQLHNLLEKSRQYGDDSRF